MPTTKYVLFYKPDPAAFPKAGALFPSHVAHFSAFREQGRLISFGAFADLVGHGSMGIFPSKADAEEFVKNDPFVKEGIVATHEIREWTDSVG
ncbi:YciI family protein [Duganella guangzhouensis]|nr:YciI family protein [Duganella guangzhouensis]